MYCCPAPRRRRAAREPPPGSIARVYTRTHPPYARTSQLSHRATIHTTGDGARRSCRPRRPPRSLSLSCLACRRLHSRHASHPTRTRTRLTPSRSAQTPRRASGGADAARYSPQIARTHSHGGWSGLLPPHAPTGCSSNEHGRRAAQSAHTSLVDSHCRHVPPSRA